MTFFANNQVNPPPPNTEFKDLIIAGAREWNLDGECTAQLDNIVTSQT